MSTWPEQENLTPRWKRIARRLVPFGIAAVYALSASLALAIITGLLSGDMGLVWWVAWRTFVGAMLIAGAASLAARKVD